MKTQEFLAAAGVEATTEVNAKKAVHQKPEALELLQNASHLFAARGKKVVEVNLRKDEPTEEELLKLVLGPTGNLRAPTLLVGKKMVVGFNQEMYEKVFG
ncbi:MAG: ArsC family (seleno)protein [Planctomycetota bacterium]